MDRFSLICLVIGTVLALATAALSLIAYKRYSQLIEGLDPKEHAFAGIYPLGFMLLDLFKFDAQGPMARKRRGECEVIYGSLYAEYYLRLNYAQKISMMLFALPVGFLLCPLLKSPATIVLGLLLVALAYWNYDMQITREMAKRQDEIARDLPDIYTKLTLLVSAGMILREAWEHTSNTGETTLYQEMRKSVMDMANGMSEQQAIMGFGQRCMDAGVKKFASTLVQNLEKGNRELTDYLKRQSSIGWEEKKQYARQKGEKASTNLTLPAVGMLVGVMIMIMVPMMGSMQFT